MFHKILIANRGEIAVRIIRTCMYMGIETVAIYSEADRESLHVQLADEAICVGGFRSKDSYLNMENIISAAINTGAEAIHPGFGFLSENPEFAQLCEDCGIIFIGPKSEHIKQMGNKSWAIKKMIEAGVPVIPGSEGVVKSAAAAIAIADKIGYPVLIKASAGGGGRGMRIAHDVSSLKSAFETAKSEAINAFGDGALYLEKYLENPRHIEFQVLCDKYDNIVHLYQRDCSIQRRNQKIIEEAPGTIDEALQKRMIEATIKACKSIKYENAGTVEFLVSGNDFYFIEMNTRIQVEHPITEMILGKDIVKEQIKIASGERLSFNQSDLIINGYSIECRINAENPKEQFQPSPGKIKLLHIPSGNGIRFDSLLYPECVIQPYYDSMIGKLIVHGENRDEAIKKMRSALEELVIHGIHTNQMFLYMIMNNPDYLKGNFDTSFIQLKLERLLEYDEDE
jgi:acetyl-CoA carboxylase biotin carboxylase subunit